MATTITANCGHTVKAVLSADIRRAVTEIEQLSNRPCMACRPRRRSIVAPSGVRVYVEG